MPIYCFKCPRDHRWEKWRSKPYKNTIRYRCKVCGLWSTRDYVTERMPSRRNNINVDYRNDPISHLTRKRSFKGIWIENLTPEPVHIKSEGQYHKLLKDTHSREKNS